MMRHSTGARRKNGDIRASRALQLELCPFKTLADFVVAHLERSLRGLPRRIIEVLDLLLAPPQQILRLGGVVAMTIDDHDYLRVGEAAEPGRNQTARKKPTKRGAGLSNRARAARGRRSGAV